MAVSLEDAHRHNDLKLLEEFSNTTVSELLRLKSQVESAEEIRSRLKQVLEHIDPPG